nr:2TM domain-containing protein [Allomuricauda sp.]
METSYERAKKRVKRLKGFYSHLSVYIIINIILIVIKMRYLGSSFSIERDGDTFVLDWSDWDIISTPLVWGLFLAIHAIKVFSYPMVQRWEKRQIQKQMDREDDSFSKFQ